MRVRRCDCCGKDIEPCGGNFLSMKKYYIRVESEAFSGKKEWHYDLCDRCAKFIENTIKTGAKPEWLGDEPKEG